jgi:tetratricopeptide (TPR) repeat protein
MAGLSTSDISKMLRSPQSVTNADEAKIAALKQAYPYFTIAQYLGALVKHKQEPYSDAMLNELQLYKGNWLLLHEFLNGPTLPATPTATETVVEPEVPHQAPPPAQAEIKAEVEAAMAIANTDEEQTEMEIPKTHKEELLIQPVYTEDYFRHEGVDVSADLPETKDIQPAKAQEEDDDEDKSLMVVMSFSEWLAYFKVKSQKEKEEEEDQRALKTMWQKEKLAAAMEEENDIIPEGVFEMAVNSITKEDDLASESLAEIHVKQGKYDKAIDMYRKLSLRNPQKSAYFARKIETILKDKQS